MKSISKVYQVSDEGFREIVKDNYSYSDILRELGLNTKGGSSTDILKKRIQELGCSTSHFDRSKSCRYNAHVIPLENILVKNSSYANIARLKQRIVKSGLLEYKCFNCGNIGKWNGKNLTLQLDHINGVNNDHRIENLRFACPNCHSQTDTYGGKNN